ncbi:thioredoxin family protein [Flavobacterium piscis]|uniref:Protein disulfide-isomerase n=1 Tax=Flavobacterium piscis TaxID=1114874 RepID=A0ABU1Y250_9FLAO|nr:thioredoxin family protein [Flavobacterium piscis]MDR7208292.1 protein disulfide-isomerase [Flavobacterium piscis]
MTRNLVALLFFLGPFLMHSQNLVWKTNLNEAIVISNEQKKPLLIFFTASGMSEKIQSEIFETLDFAVWSRDNVVLVKLDLSNNVISQAERDQNLKVKNAFGVVELPQICFAMATSKKGKTTFNALGKIGYISGGPKVWIVESNEILHP